ncbi:MAG: hypothetical protein PHS34_09720 [Candidatus Omnitrophica bacterium]|nr:hypothetical protein [Candidatus Omnitrophota bacterium]
MVKQCLNCKHYVECLYNKKFDIQNKMPPCCSDYEAKIKEDIYYTFKGERCSNCHAGILEDNQGNKKCTNNYTNCDYSEKKLNLIGEVVQMNGVYDSAPENMQQTCEQIGEQLKKKIFEGNEKKPNEFTAYEIAKKANIYSRTGRPHEILIVEIRKATRCPEVFSRVVRPKMGMVLVDYYYYNSDFLQYVIELFDGIGNGSIELNGNSYRFIRIK